ncbi:hypothetical protein O6H91_13G091100 [Diphasiastrum complanatum]|uniref:Uncharacterized protein n=1 Tax=Diphasiastrum complanatum TaxID=34168 RepID=A0ACC2BXC9_DIPCM|nr:hypothetical protein O6H91_13G091100 [Diphasiastrum complanatum]
MKIILLAGSSAEKESGVAKPEMQPGGWKAAPPIFAVELFERLGTLGLQRNLITYFVNKMYLSVPKSANMVSNFVGALYLTPFIGGFVADAYTGRFWAIILFASIQLIGMVLLTLSSALPSLRPPECSSLHGNECRAAHGSEVAVLFMGLYLIALGNGGIRTNVSALGADQFDENDPKEKQQMSHFFNWFYFVISVGSLCSVTVIVYLQDNIGFKWAFGISSVLFFIGIIVFYYASPWYRQQPPGGSPLTRIAQVLVAATRKWNLPYPSDASLLYEDNSLHETLAHTDQFRFLDKAAVVDGKENPEHAVNPWRLCTVTQVEELKTMIRLLPIWASTIIVWTALSQMETFSVQQGATMKRNIGRHFKFPPASMSIFELVSVLFFLPLYDKFFVPFASKHTGHSQGITGLQRIGTGMVFAILAMVIAGAVEVRRVQAARDHGLLDMPKATIPITIFWLIPQYFLRGTTEIFTQVGQLEFFYRESPERLHGVGTALYLSTLGVGHFVSSVLVSTVRKATRHGGDHPGWLPNNLNRGKLKYFYWLLAILTSLNFVFYLFCARWYKYKSTEQRAESPQCIAAAAEGDHEIAAV